MQSLFEALQDKKQTVSPLGGEKNFLIQEQFLKPLNKARMLTNLQNYAIAVHANKSLTRDEFKKSKAYLPPLSHARLARTLKDYDKDALYRLLGFCKEGNNFAASFWWKIKQNKTTLNK